EQKVHFDTITTTLLNRSYTVHSATNSNGNKLTCSFQLPDNTYQWRYKISVNRSDVDDIECKFSDYENAQNFLSDRDYHYKKSINVFNQTNHLSSPLSGKYSFLFHNKNTFTGIDIRVNVQAKKIRVIKTIENVVKTHQVPYL